MRIHIVAATAAFALTAAAASASEYPVGEPKHEGGMEIAAVYLQPIEMDPPGVMLSADEADIHLEADIHAAADNPNGLAEGAWVPYLTVRYTVEDADGAVVRDGVLMPMVASDGPHYGDNVAMPGPGRYTLVLTVEPPTVGATGPLGRHTDRETGVGPWFDPITVEYDFVYAGTGKKGTY